MQYLGANPKLLNLNQEHHSKILYFLVKPLIWIKSRDKILLVTSRTEIKTPKALFRNKFSLKRPRVANFVDIIKVATIFIKATFKDSKKFFK